MAQRAQLCAPALRRLRESLGATATCTAVQLLNPTARPIHPTAAPTARLGALQTAGGLGVKEKSTFGGDVTTEGAVIATGSEATPASATATCVKGQLQWDANYVYMCTASNTWKRSALSTWA